MRSERSVVWQAADGGGKERKGFALSRSPTRKIIFLDL
jgi:hypothetical protein